MVLAVKRGENRLVFGRFHFVAPLVWILGISFTAVAGSPGEAHVHHRVMHVTAEEMPCRKVLVSHGKPVCTIGTQVT